MSRQNPRFMSKVQVVTIYILVVYVNCSLCIIERPKSITYMFASRAVTRLEGREAAQSQAEQSQGRSSENNIACDCSGSK